MTGALLFIVLASMLVPIAVAWCTSRAGQPFRSWKAHPWIFFWCTPFVLFVLFLPSTLIWRQQIPSIVMVPTAALSILSTVVVVLSAVHGLRQTYRRSRWKATLVITFFVVQGAFSFLLSGGPPALRAAPTSDVLAVLLSLFSGIVFAAWLGLMAGASEFASTWLTARR